MYCLPRQTKDSRPRRVVRLWWVGRRHWRTGWRAEQYGRRSPKRSWSLWSGREKGSSALACFESVTPLIDCFWVRCFYCSCLLWSGCFCGQKEEALESFWWLVFCQSIHCFDWLFCCIVEMYCWDHRSRCSHFDDPSSRVGGSWLFVHVVVTLVKISSKMDHDQQGLLPFPWTWNTLFNRIACATLSRRWKAC